MFTTDYLVVFDIETAAANMLLCVKCKSKMFGHINVYRPFRVTRDKDSHNIEIVLVEVEGLYVVWSLIAGECSEKCPGECSGPHVFPFAAPRLPPTSRFSALFSPHHPHVPHIDQKRKQAL
jgi:hypothetical protein